MQTNNTAGLGTRYYYQIKAKGDIDMKMNMGLMAFAAMGVMAAGAVGLMMSNTKAARRRRMIKRAVKTVHNVGSAVQKMTAF